MSDSTYYRLDSGGDAVSVAHPLPVTAASLPIPTGAATAAKQAAPGTAGTASTDVTTVQGIASGTPVIIGGALAHDAVYSGNPVPIAAYASAAIPTAVSTADIAHLWSGLNGQLAVFLCDTSGLAANLLAGNSDAVASSTRGLAVDNLPQIWNGTAWERDSRPNATSRILSSAATTNATSAKASLGQLFMATGRNTTATVLYLKLYNKASAPTVGTDTPVATLPCPPAANFAWDWPKGRSFSIGIAYALTTGSADNDTGAVAAGDIIGLNLDYA